MKSIILTHSMFQDQEILYPYYRLREEGEVVLVAEAFGKIKGILGTEIEAECSIDSGFSNEEGVESFLNLDLLVLPGGVKAMEKLRQNAYALHFVACWFDLGKPIASMCSGAQMLLSARVPLKGRRLAAYPAMAVDVENAGATFVNEPVVVDGNLVSSPHYKYLAEWMRAAIDIAKGKKEMKHFYPPHPSGVKHVLLIIDDDIPTKHLPEEDRIALVGIDKTAYAERILTNSATKHLLPGTEFGIMFGDGFAEWQEPPSPLCTIIKKTPPK